MDAPSTRKPKPEFTWRHYLFGSNMIAGVLQTFALILVGCAVCTFAMMRSSGAS